MKITSVKRFSFLGLTLVAASAITAAIIPSKGKSASKANAFRNAGVAGLLVNSVNTPGQKTCKAAGSGACWNTFSRLNNGQSGTTVAGFDPTSNHTTAGDVS